jgi:hypothetical protein
MSIETPVASPPTPASARGSVTPTAHRQPNIRRHSAAWFGAGALFTGGLALGLYVGVSRPEQQATAAAAKKLAATELYDQWALGHEKIDVAKGSLRVLHGRIVADISSNATNPKKGCSDTFNVVHTGGSVPVTLEVPAVDPLSHNQLANPNSTSGEVVVNGPKTAQAVVNILQKYWEMPKHDGC